MHALNYLSKKLRVLTKNTLTKSIGISSCSCRFYNDISSEDLSDITLSNIRRKLKTHRVKFDEGHACLLAECLICSTQATQPKSSKIYINKTTGYFSCQCCKYSGSWKILEKFFSSRNNEKTTKELLKDPRFCSDIYNNKQIISSTKLLSKLSEENVNTVLNKFNFPIASKPSLNLLNVRIDEQHESIYIPLLDLESRVSGYKILNSSTDAEKTLPPSNGFGLLSARASRAGGCTAVVVPSVKDLVTLLDAKIPGSVICLPYGLANLPQSILPSFERYTKLTLWFGNELSSWDAARNFAKKLGEKRCFFVRPTDNQPLPHAAATAGQDLKAILSAAQPIWHKSITTFSSLRQDVLSELQNIDKVQGVKWKRFPTLNKILKGHRRGELTIITGPTGCGKTTFISEYSLDLAMQKVNTLWGSFEIRNARLARTMLQQMAGCELDEHLDQFDEWADDFEQLPIYFMTFHGQQPIKVVMEAVEHATYVHDIAHVIVDNVQFMMGISDESKHHDRFWKQDAIVASFRAFATRKNCHVTLVMHPRKERDADELTTSSIFGGAKASQEADNVLIIQDKRLTSLRGKKYLQVVKNRYTGDLGIMPMDFDKSALSYAQKKKKTEDKISVDIT